MITNLFNFLKLEYPSSFNLKKEEKDNVIELEFVNNDKDSDSKILFSYSNAERISYLFPGIDFLLSNENANLSIPYSTYYPLSFLTVIINNIGITLISLNGDLKNFMLEKKNSNITFGINYKENINPKLLIYRHSPDWHEGLAIYRKNFIENNTIKQSKFMNAFNIKRYFMHENNGENPYPIKNNIFKNNNYYLYDEYKKDSSVFGGIDLLQIYDWAYSTDGGRTGTYNPVSKLINIDELNNQIEKIKDDGKKVLAYFDAYICQANSELKKHFDFNNQIISIDNKLMNLFNKELIPICIYQEKWVNYIVNNLIEVNNKMAIDGLYLDEVGNCVQYVCYSREHNHSIPSNQLNGERLFLKKIKDNIDSPLLIEYFPPDSIINYVDGCLIDCKGIVIIARFALPHIKIFLLITCDEPIGDNLWPINVAFFNGVGIWLDGDSKSDLWYSKDAINLIRKHYLIMHNYQRFFESYNVVPLIDCNSQFILVNKFMDKEDTLYTVLNVSGNDFNGPLINVTNDYNKYEYIDLYNNKPIDLVFINGYHFLSYKIDKRSVGVILCIKRIN